MSTKTSPTKKAKVKAKKPKGIKNPPTVSAMPEYLKGVTPITKEEFETVCKRLEIGDDGLKAILDSMGRKKEQLYSYLVRATETETDQYARALRMRADHMAERLQDIIEECKEKVESIDDPKRANALVQAYKLQVDDIKWLMAKRLPKKYGTLMDQQGDGPVSVVFAVPRPTTEQQADNKADVA